MEKEIKTLSPEVIDGIVPFSGPSNLVEKAVYEGKAIQRVQTPYTTALAVQKPRNLSRIVANVIEEAKLAGSSFYYGWTTKNKDGSKGKIEGPSIDLAMCLARNYGNCAIDVGIDDENSTHFTLRGVFIDLESGFTCPRLFKQRRRQSIGMKSDDGREEDIVFQIGQSKAIRNAIVRAMPDWLVQKAIDEAKQAEIRGIKPENLVFARAKVLEFFRQYGIEQNRIELKVEKPLDAWTPEIIVELRASATALKEGRISANELFPEDKPEVKKEPEATAEKKAETAKTNKKTSKKTEEKPEEKPEPAPLLEEMAPSECPNNPGTTHTKVYCDACKDRLGCPAWE